MFTRYISTQWFRTANDNDQKSEPRPHLLPETAQEQSWLEGIYRANVPSPFGPFACNIGEVLIGGGRYLAFRLIDTNDLAEAETLVNEQFQRWTTDLNTMFDQYVLTALWNSTDDKGRPMDALYTKADIHPDALAIMLEDCQVFLMHQYRYVKGSYSDAGHDFWLTRNRSGSGFWDGDWPFPQAQRLTQASHQAGESHLYLGDDDHLHISSERLVPSITVTSEAGRS